MNDAVVTVRGLRRAFGPQQVLDDLELDIADGEFVAMLGRSGSGKSTLLRALAGLDEHVDRIGGRPPLARRRLPEPAAAAVAARPGQRHVRAARRRAGHAQPRPPAGAPRWPRWACPTRRTSWPLTLSGGEAQRVSLARALVREPDLLLLDEPFGALDALTRLKMYRLLHDLWSRRHMAVLHVTHDVDEAILLADRVVVLSGGRVSLDRPREPALPTQPGRRRFRRAASHPARRTRVCRRRSAMTESAVTSTS